MTTAIKKVSTNVVVDKYEADETISALKLVTATSDSNAEVAEPDTFANSKVLGLAMTTGNLGDKIKILTFGPIKDPFFTFGLNEELFLGPSGVVTNNVAGLNFVTRIGHSLGSGAIFIDIDTAKTQAINAGSDAVFDLGERTTLDTTADFGNRIN